MSSGASAVYEKPRSGRSICIEETPRSSRIASASTPLPASCSRTTAKSPRRKRVCASRPLREAVEVRPRARVAVDRDQLAAALEVGGEQRRVPAGAEGRVDDRLAGLHREQLAHLVGENGDVVSRAGCKTFGNILRTPFDFGQLLAPGGAVPDLEPVVDAGDDDLPAQLRVLDQLGGDHHAALFVELGLGAPRRRRCLWRRRPSGLSGSSADESRLDESIPIRTTEGVEAAVEAPR